LRPAAFRILPEDNIYIRGWRTQLHEGIRNVPDQSLFLFVVIDIPHLYRYNCSHDDPPYLLKYYLGALGPRWGLPHCGQRLTSLSFILNTLPQEQVTSIFAMLLFL
jgi:hypothetical protein